MTARQVMIERLDHAWNYSELNAIIYSTDGGSSSGDRCVNASGGLSTFRKLYIFDLFNKCTCSVWSTLVVSATASIYPFCGLWHSPIRCSFLQSLLINEPFCTSHFHYLIIIFARISMSFVNHIYWDCQLKCNAWASFANIEEWILTVCWLLVWLCHWPHCIHTILGLITRLCLCQCRG